ncbi:MAG: nucleotide exchange factor GrpE [Candidatus Thermoplasmatota archaeon]|nr:nucleotide exchange factor GrpE [Candidatus Thermoplasmatota archaeon]MCL5731420.1 nucleotide exchange factor GrpE [Candidatus Thermoplasmatota archaeon]
MPSQQCREKILPYTESILQSDLDTVKEISCRSAQVKLRRIKDYNGKLEREVLSTREKMMRAVADSNNLLKAKERELAIETRRANKSLIIDILPVLDSMDAAINSGHGGDNLKGIRDQLIQALSRHGLKAIESVGGKYDPFRHEVLGVIDQGDDGTVHEEIQKGYLLNDEVIRSAKVIVTKR